VSFPVPDVNRDSDRRAVIPVWPKLGVSAAKRSNAYQSKSASRPGWANSSVGSPAASLASTLRVYSIRSGVQAGESVVPRDPKTSPTHPTNSSRARRMAGASVGPIDGVGGRPGAEASAARYRPYPSIALPAQTLRKRSVSESALPATPDPGEGMGYASRNRETSPNFPASPRRDSNVCPNSTRIAKSGVNDSDSTTCSIGTPLSRERLDSPLEDHASNAASFATTWTNAGDPASSPWNSPNCHWRASIHSGSRIRAARPSETVLSDRGRGSSRFQ